MGRAFTEAAMKQRAVNMASCPLFAIWEGARMALVLTMVGFLFACLTVLLLPEVLAPARRCLALRACLLECGGSFMEAAGHISALFGRMPEPYKTTDGH
jgi:hypothetical protein